MALVVVEQMGLGQGFAIGSLSDLGVVAKYVVVQRGGDQVVWRNNGCGYVGGWAAVGQKGCGGGFVIEVGFGNFVACLISGGLGSGHAGLLQGFGAL